MIGRETPIVATPSEQVTGLLTDELSESSLGSTIGTTLPITSDVPRTQVNPSDDASAPIIDIPFTQGDNNRSGTIALQTGS